MTQPPSELEWRSEPWCLDARSAYVRFNGKTLDEARAMFSEDALNRQEDLMFMPAVCLRFYLPAYLDYLTSDAARGDSNGASCLFGLIDHRFDDIIREAELRQRVITTVTLVASQQDWYEADRSIYGSFQRKADQILLKSRRFDEQTDATGDG